MLIFMFKKKNKSTYSIKDEYKNYPDEDDPIIKSYINDRLLAQIVWYDNKSQKYQKNYKRLSILSFVMSAIIPVFTLLLDLGLVIKIVIAVLSSTVTIITSIQALYSHKELWLQYRSNCEILKSTLHFYKSKNGEFYSENNLINFRLLVEQCEKHMTEEFKQWSAYYKNINQSSTNS